MKFIAKTSQIMRVRTFLPGCSCKISRYRIIRRNCNTNRCYIVTLVTYQVLSINKISQELRAELHGENSVEATDVTHDSRQAKQGTLFVAIKGHTMDGHRF